jgi:hypothetical protein
MDKKLELLLRAICAYEINGEANFNLKCLDFFGHENTVRRNIQKLEELEDNGLPLILKTNLNGMYSRYKINKVLDCPEFIYESKFELTYKCILLALYNNINNIPENITPTSISKITGISYNTIKKYWKDDILNDLNNYSRPIKLNLSGELENSEYGLKYIGQRKSEYKCQFCGEENPKMFDDGNHSTCKKCKYERRKNRTNSDMAQKLYDNSKRSYRTRANIEKYDLTKDYIQELLEEQNYKCYYTKVDLKVGTKLTNPTIDRIDSSKGYIQGNVVICTEICNIMKNDLSTEEFKSQINLLYNNISNF